MTHPAYDFLKFHDMTQPQLAEKAGITTEFLHMILKGRRWPGYKLALRLERITGIRWPVWISFSR